MARGAGCRAGGGQFELSFRPIAAVAGGTKFKNFDGMLFVREIGPFERGGSGAALMLCVDRLERELDSTLARCHLDALRVRGMRWHCQRERLSQ